jgi:hypothetical protein
LRNVSNTDLEAEPDYVALTRDKAQVTDICNNSRQVAVDHGFLKHSASGWGLAAKNKNGYYDFDDGGAKRKVVKVDRNEFRDVTENMNRAKEIEAFKARFGGKKPNSSGKKLLVEMKEENSDDDLEKFLDEVHLGGGGGGGGMLCYSLTFFHISY